MTISPELLHVYDRLNSAGIDDNQISQVLPEWFDYEIADTPAGFQQVCLMLASRLGVTFESLITPKMKIEFKLNHKRVENDGTFCKNFGR